MCQLTLFAFGAVCLLVLTQAYKTGPPVGLDKDICQSMFPEGHCALTGASSSASSSESSSDEESHSHEEGESDSLEEGESDSHEEGESDSDEEGESDSYEEGETDTGCYGKPTRAKAREDASPFEFVAPKCYKANTDIYG